MSSSEFRNRGVEVVVDTTQAAEFDIKGIQVSDTVMDRIARALKSLQHSPRDKVVGDVRVREIEGYDVIFFVTREPEAIVINIGGVMMHESENKAVELLKQMETLAILRGVTGL